MDNREEPFSKLPGESHRAFHCFAHYRDMGPGRSLHKAYAEHIARCVGRQGSIRRASGRWHQWSVDWRWHERATAYDAYLDQQRREAAIQAAKDEAIRWERERAAQRERELEAGKALVARATEMLRFPLANIEIRKGEDGIVQEVHPARWSFESAARMFETASKLIRLAAEMETSRAAVDMSVVEREAKRIGDELGLSAEEVLAEAQRILQETE